MAGEAACALFGEAACALFGLEIVEEDEAAGTSPA
jgi:hypothetical protein